MQYDPSNPDERESNDEPMEKLRRHYFGPNTDKQSNNISKSSSDSDIPDSLPTLPFPIQLQTEDRIADDKEAFEALEETYKRHRYLSGIEEKMSTSEPFTMTPKDREELNQREYFRELTEAWYLECAKHTNGEANNSDTNGAVSESSESLRLSF